MTPAPHQAPAEDRAEIAAGWVERLTAGEATPGEIAELREWIAVDPANRLAYEQARAIWTELPETALRRRRPPLRLVAGTALAACLALFLALPGFHDHATGAGEVERIVLPDGSTAWLDSDSAIDLAFDDSGRTIRLARGRIAIDVAADDARPLAIEAGDARITDVGTVFSVDRAEGLRVAVEQGLVDVSLDGRTVRLRAGEAGGFDSAGPRLRPARTGEFAWRDGRIVFDQMPLGSALAELDRYFNGRVVLTDSRLAARRVSGTLFADRAEEGVATLAKSQGLAVTHLPWLILVGPAD